MNYFFNGERLRAARRYRNMSISDLAEAISLTKQMVSKYENETSTPSFDTMKKISDILNFPLDFFENGIDNEILFQGTGSFFRSRYSATQAEKQASHIQKGFLDESLKYLKMKVGFIDIDVLNDKPDNLSPQNFATWLRNYWNLGNIPIKNIAVLLEAKGFILSNVDFSKERVNAISGYSYDHKNYLILYEGRGRTFYQQQFSLAHELGHALLHADKLNPFELESVEYKNMEREANQFASSFLLPEDLLKQYVGKLTKKITLKDIMFLKEKTYVSMAAIIYRLNEVNIIDERDYTRLMKGMSANGYRKLEPGDLEKRSLTPTTMARALDLLIEYREIDSEEDLQENISEKTGVTLPGDSLAMIFGGSPITYDRYFKEQDSDDLKFKEIDNGPGLKLL